MPIERKISSAEKALMAATTREIRHALAPILALNLANPPPDWGLAQPIYVEILKDLPIDLIQAAVMNHISTSEWFPKPAQIRALAIERLDHRRAELSYWREQKEEATQPTALQPTDEDLETVDALMSAEFGDRRSAERRERPLPAEVTEAVKRAAKALKTFRLPDEDNPVVQEWLRQM